MQVITTLKTVAAAAGLAVAFSVTAASAATISLDYDRLPPDTQNQGVAEHLVTLVSDNTTSALFHFEVSSNTADIREIYFADGANLFSGISIFGSSGVNYTIGNATPGNLSAGNTADPSFVASTGLNATPTNPVSGVSKIDFGDFLTLALSYNDGISFANVEDALSLGSLRVGVRAGVPVSSYVSRATGETTVIPLPAAGWLLLTAMGGLGAAGLRRRRKAA